MICCHGRDFGRRKGIDWTMIVFWRSPQERCGTWVFYSLALVYVVSPADSTILSWGSRPRFVCGSVSFFILFRWVLGLYVPTEKRKIS